MQEVHHTLFHIKINKLQLHTKEKVKVELLWFHFESTMRLLLKLSRDNSGQLIALHKLL